MILGLILTILFPDVFVSVKVILGKLDFLLVSSFSADSTSLASRTCVVVDVSCSCCDDFVTSEFPFFPSWEVVYAIWGPKDFLLYQTNPASSELLRFVLLALLT